VVKEGTSGRKFKELWDDKGIDVASVSFWNRGIIIVMKELYL